MELDLITFLIVCPLVFLGGLVDAVAGGGGLIALPAYLIAGVPAHLALGTNKLSSAMGTVVSAFRLWRAGFLNIRKSLPAIVCSLLGSAAGAHLALLVPERVFELILVGLLPIAAFFVLSKRAVMSNDEGIITARKQLVILCIASLICGAYDGFYGPGAGTFMLLAFTLWAKMGVRSASGTMKAVNLASNIAAFATFALSGDLASWSDRRDFRHCRSLHWRRVSASKRHQDCSADHRRCAGGAFCEDRLGALKLKPHQPSSAVSSQSDFVSRVLPLCRNRFSL